jgi:hypothetical protein
MATFFATLTVFGVVVLAMAVGVIVHGRRLKGSCGGTGEACTCSAVAARACPIRHEREARAVVSGRASG